MPRPWLLMPEGAGALGRMVKAAQTWVVARYLPVRRGEAQGADAGDGPAAEGPTVYSSDLFAGMPPGKRMQFMMGGLSKAEALREQYSQKLKGFRPVWAGPLSDHCVGAAPEDDRLLFSLQLAEGVFLQAVIERQREAWFDERITGSPHVPGYDPIPRRLYEQLQVADRAKYPMTAIIFRTVRIKNGLPEVMHSTEPLRVIETPTIAALVIGEDSAAPVALTHQFTHTLLIVTRDGRFRLVRSGLCHRWLGVTTRLGDDGRRRLVIVNEEGDGTQGSVCQEQEEIDALSEAWMSDVKAGPRAPSADAGMADFEGAEAGSGDVERRSALEPADAAEDGQRGD